MYQQMVAVRDVEVIKFPLAVLSLPSRGSVSYTLRVPDPLPNKRYTWVVTSTNTLTALTRSKTGKDSVVAILRVTENQQSQLVSGHAGVCSKEQRLRCDCFATTHACCAAMQQPLLGCHRERTCSPLVDGVLLSTKSLIERLSAFVAAGTVVTFTFSALTTVPADFQIASVRVLEIQGRHSDGLPKSYWSALENSTGCDGYQNQCCVRVC